MRFLVSLITVLAAVTACSEAEVEPTISATATPQFEVITVTPPPEPTATAVPVFTPTPSASVSADAPKFPDWLDPELNESRPSDDEIFEGWQAFLENTRLRFSNGNQVHFCSDGVVIMGNGETLPDSSWQATRTAAMSKLKWGQIALVAVPTNGPSFTVMQIERREGKIWQLDWTAPTEIQIDRSDQCLEMMAS